MRQITTVLILMTIAFNSYSQEAIRLGTVTLIDTSKTDVGGVHLSTHGIFIINGQSNYPRAYMKPFEAKPEPQIGSFTIKVPCNCVCEPEPRTFTDKITDYYYSIIDRFKTKKKKRVGP